jgi:hypothetical protein
MIEKKTRSNGATYYINLETGKFASRKDYIKNLGSLEVEQLRETNQLSKRDKQVIAANKRLRLNGKFISKREETFFKDLFKNKGIKREGNEISNLIPSDLAQKLRRQREDVTETVKKYQGGRKNKVFDIFGEVKNAVKDKKEIRINGEKVNQTEAIKRISEFIKKANEGLKNPPLIIWQINVLNDGDIMDFDLEETQIIPSE